MLDFEFWMKVSLRDGVLNGSLIESGMTRGRFRVVGGLGPALPDRSRGQAARG